jgi:hypothetical protein
METTFDYLRLCGIPHKRRYVWMSVMLSGSMKRLIGAASGWLMAT